MCVKYPLVFNRKIKCRTAYFFPPEPVFALLPCPSISSSPSQFALFLLFLAC